MDLTTAVTVAASQIGLLPSAVPDAITRARQRFGAQAEQSQDAIEQWCAQLRTEAAHLFAPAQPPTMPEWLSPSEKLTRARAGTPPAPRRRPQPVTLTEAQEQELAALSPTQRLTRYREMQQAAQQEP